MEPPYRKLPAQKKRGTIKKAPTLQCGALVQWRALQPARACSKLLGCGSAGCSSCSSISSSLGCVSGGGSGSRGSVGSGRSGFRSGGSWCGRWSWGFHGSGCWRRSWLFLLATSGECSSSDQGGQNERVLHFDFPSWTDRILRSHGVRLCGSPGTLWHNALGMHRLGAATDYIGI